MTASQHLRAILSFLEYNAKTYVPPSVRETMRRDLVRSLPALIAVIEAAEAVDDEHQADLPAAVGTANRLHDALAALREQLEANA